MELGRDTPARRLLPEGSRHHPKACTNGLVAVKPHGRWLLRQAVGVSRVSSWLTRTDLYPLLASKGQGGNKGARRGFCSPFVPVAEEGGPGDASRSPGSFSYQNILHRLLNRLGK
jgi:hypothetical protein